MKMSQLYTPNSLDIKSKEMSLPKYMDPKWRDVGGRKGIRYEKVVFRNSKTGGVYGMRSLAQKNT